MLLSAAEAGSLIIRPEINAAYRADEIKLLQMLIKKAELSSAEANKTEKTAINLVKKIRNERQHGSGIDSFLIQYSLSSEEGIALMCLAEALLRVPDSNTIDRLIKDKLGNADWESHKGQSESFFVNATTWALMLTGKVLTPEQAENKLTRALRTFLNRSGEGVVRVAVEQAMRIMSKQFVMGRTINEALKRAKKHEAIGYRYSYDMLGEAALTMPDAKRYFEAYKKAIKAIGESVDKSQPINNRPGISIKLSALYPRYSEAQRIKVLEFLPNALVELAQLAKHYNIGLTVDAEESERLELSLDVIKEAFSHESLHDWHGFGVAVQSYQKRAYFVLDYLAELARNAKRRMNIRLIKGAYWDSEIKKAQILGLDDYPVWTRKAFTDVSFQACAKKLLSMTDVFYPQFATHNAYSVAMILNLVGDYKDFEFQCLHGMGQELYEQIVPKDKLGIPCRIYAPVGSHEDLLPYLVRRLLENGANTSFVHRIVDAAAPIESLVADPVAKSKQLLGNIKRAIPLPKDIFQPHRTNSKGIDWTSRQYIHDLMHEYSKMNLDSWYAAPLPQQKPIKNPKVSKISSPQNRKVIIGSVQEASIKDADWALEQSVTAFNDWSKMPVDERSHLMERYGKLLHENSSELMAILCLEAGKTWSDAIGEIREAVDFCNYYAEQARELMHIPLKLQGYTGELNELSLHPRGTILCISPWNFPLAIFTGQIIAALVTGNTVIAKPAEQTPLIAMRAVQLMHEAGIPQHVIQLLPGSGSTIGAHLVKDHRIKGVVFTGSTQTANIINHSLAKRSQEIIPLIAETGGQNVMIVDSSALLEQVVQDVIVSAFGSAGQRCSALRVLYLQKEIYPRTIELLKGAMAELNVGDPKFLHTDLGPVIDEEALKNLKKHVKDLTKKHKIIYQCKLPTNLKDGVFMAPTAIAVPNINVLAKENFGPILHVISYDSKKLDQVITDVNSTGFGLTLGIHSRINSTVEYIRSRIHVGNCYVNRNMIGAVVGLQPFGGEGLSGTGPKAGGPHYLTRFCHERTFTVDTTAAGGNASLMAIESD